MRLMRTTRERLLMALLITLAIVSVSLGQTTNQGEPTGKGDSVDFNSFIAVTRQAKFEDYARRPGAKVTNQKEFDKMKKHILSMYDGVKVKNSFVMGESGFTDCVDVNTQPSLRRGGTQRKVQAPPKSVVIGGYEADSRSKAVEPMLSREKKDRFGNAMYCEEGFIPMQRVTLEQLTRFRTLEDFFNKFGKAGKSDLPTRD